VLEERGALVAHLGVMTVPVVLDGERRTVGALHAAAVHPRHRARGHLRALMAEALAWCDERFETCALDGDEALYSRFGFRRVREHRFRAALPSPVVPAQRPLRLTSVDDPADVALWGRLLATRAPVSERAGIVEDKDVFCFNAAALPIHHAPDLDALIDFRVEDCTLKLYDVVAPRMPSLAELVGAVGRPVARVEVHFAPDRLATELVAEPYVPGSPDDPHLWMVRGAWTDAPFQWPRTARW
jgi:hypothetical protein